MPELRPLCWCLCGRAERCCCIDTEQLNGVEMFVCVLHLYRGVCGMDRGLRVVEATRAVPALQSCSDYSCCIPDLLPRRGCSAAWPPHSCGHGLPTGALNTKREAFLVQTLTPAPLVQCLSQQRSEGSSSGIRQFHSLNKPCGSGHLQAVSSPAKNHLFFGSCFHHSS